MEHKSIYLAECEPDAELLFVSMGIIQLLLSKMKKIAIFRPIIQDTLIKDPTLLYLLDYFQLEQSYDATYGLGMEEVEISLIENHFSMCIETCLLQHKKLCSEYDFVVVMGLDHKSYPTNTLGLLNHVIARNLQTVYIPILSGKNKAIDHIHRQIALEENAIESDYIEKIAFFITQLGREAYDHFRHQECDPKSPIFYIQNTVSSDIFLQYFMDVVNIDFLNKRIQNIHSNVITPTVFEYGLLEKTKKYRKKVVLPESDDPRILHAVQLLLAHDCVDLILLGNPSIIYSHSRALGIDLTNVAIIDPEISPLKDQYAQILYTLRREKGMTLQEAYALLQHRTYFGTMMVHQSDADAMVCGATHTTQETIRPALEIIKTLKGISRVSSLFFMCFEDKVLVYADCAINEHPTAEELAEIAIISATNANAFGIEPRVAMLSYSTGHSGDGDDVDKVREATRLVRLQAPGLKVEGPIQYDAAIDPDVARLKLPHSEVAGEATVFIFPDLNTGNNTYKAVQRSSNALAIGPILQGLRRPINDLSRGCNVDDIVNTVLISAIQAQQDSV